MGSFILESMLFPINVVAENSDYEPNSPDNTTHLMQAQHEQPDDEIDRKA